MRLQKELKRQQKLFSNAPYCAPIAVNSIASFSSVSSYMCCFMGLNNYRFFFHYLIDKSQIIFNRKCNSVVINKLDNNIALPFGYIHLSFPSREMTFTAIYIYILYLPSIKSIFDSSYAMKVSSDKITVFYDCFVVIKNIYTFFVKT